MNTIWELAGVALAALLSENMVLVNCLGVGTYTKAFQQPREALRTGLELAAVSSWLPAFLSVIVVVVLHLWKHNNLLSIFGGTVFYMVLIQRVFV